MGHVQIQMWNIMYQSATNPMSMVNTLSFPGVDAARQSSCETARIVNGLYTSSTRDVEWFAPRTIPLILLYKPHSPMVDSCGDIRVRYCNNPYDDSYTLHVRLLELDQNLEWKGCSQHTLTDSTEMITQPCLYWKTHIWALILMQSRQWAQRYTGQHHLVSWLRHDSCVTSS